MNQHPIVLLDPVFRWLDDVIRDYGLYIYMVCVWLRRRSAKLTHLCSAKLTHRFRAGNAASSFQVAECFAFRGSGWRRACGVRDYARALSKSFQSCSEGRRRLTVGCRAIIARAMSSPTASASKPQ